MDKEPLPSSSPSPSRTSSDQMPVDDAVWIDVIRQMDEVYARLVQDEVALEEKNAQLEASQNFIFSLLSSMSDVLIACREDGGIEQTNTALCRLVGQSEAELLGQQLRALLADEQSAARLRAAIASPDAQRGGASAEVLIVDARGQQVPVDFNCSLRRSSTGQVVGHVLIGRPLGEIKRAYHELREAHEALKRAQAQLLHSEKLASLGRLVAGVAHELNNPISFVLGNVHALQRYAGRFEQYLGAVHQSPQPPQVQALREKLRVDHMLGDMPSLMEGTIEGAQRTADIVNGLKRFSAADREEFSRFDLGEVIERAIHWVRKGTAPRFQIEFDRTPECMVTGHSGQMLQVAMNLIQNAYDACSARADVTPVLHITLGHTGISPSDSAAPGTRASGTTAPGPTAPGVRATFEDNGGGIAPEHMARIFDPFFTTKGVGKGTGLGLSISYGIVERHGGTLVAANNAQGGASFTLSLPASG